ncbi:MAG: LysM peptidoglycan-binding domain-containing protein [Desulfobacteraceae bacterium]|nr:LysM peptidoglycan-binding domain-containing protein [Desulfobacteraceae bacterium]
MFHNSARCVCRRKKKNPKPSAPKEDYYIVKKGDTLWDISQKLLKSPWRWKILWDQNKDIPIPNPNLIYPGQKLRLISTASPPPTAKPAPAPPPSAPPEPLPEEVISDTPAQIPEPPPAAPPYYIYSPINRVGFIRKEQIVSEGAILRGRDVKNNLSTGDLVYIREPNDKPMTIGKQYTIFRTLPIREEQRFIGIQHRMIGLVEISEKESQGIVIGKIIESYRPIVAGDLLMSNVPRSPRVILSESRNGINGKILMSEDNTKAFGEHHTVFIDKGEKGWYCGGAEIYGLRTHKNGRGRVSGKDRCL